MLKKLFTHSMLYALGPQVPKLASIVVLPLVTPHLSANDYGTSATVSAWLGLLGGFRGLGLDAVLVRSFYSKRRNWPLIWRQILGWLSAWSILFSLIQAGLLAIVLPTDARQHLLTILFLLCVPAAICEPTTTVGGRLLQLKERPGFIAVTSAFCGALGIALNYVTIAVFKLGFLGWFVSQAVTTMVQASLYAIPLYGQYGIRPAYRFRLSTLRARLRVSLPVVPHQYSTYLLHTSDRLVMDLVGVKLSEVGRYGLAYTLGGYLDALGTAVGMAAGPFITKTWAEGTLDSKRRGRALVFALQAAFIVGPCTIALWSREILGLLIRNKELQAAYPLAAVVAISFSYRPMYWAVVNKLIYAGRTSQLWKLSFVAGIGNVVMNLALIPSFGVEAAALTTFAALLYLGFAGFALRAYRDLHDLPYYPLTWVVAICVSGAAAYALRDASYIVKAAATLGGVGALGTAAFMSRRELRSGFDSLESQARAKHS